MQVSPHCHIESHLTGSTLASFIDKAKKLDRKYFAYTDNGNLSSVLKAYNLSNKKGLKFIAGLEIYFKDPSCEIISGTKASSCKYFTGTVYCKDQTAYQELCKMVSRVNTNTIEIYEETQQLWNWEDLNHISKFNVDFLVSGPHCMVGKPMLAGNPDSGNKVLLKLKDIFKNNLYVGLVAEPWGKKWQNIVEIIYTDGSRDTLLSTDVVSTDKVRKIKALDLVERNHHTIIVSKSVNYTYYSVNKTIQSVKLHKGFLPLPGGDVTLRINRFLLALARKYEITILVTDYAYYAEKEDKIVQTMKLEGKSALSPNLYMKDGQEILSYLNNILGLSKEDSQQIINNNAEWAKRYDGFKLKYDWRLASIDGDPIRIAMDIIKKNGRMKWDEPVWVDRLKEEINVIAKNGIKDLTPYFLPIYDVMNFYNENDTLIGPLRGSCGGSLFCYLLGITQVDPFKYDLPFNRFFSMDRILTGKLPDIDSDLSSRDILVGADGKSGFLYGKYGDRVSQISTRNTIRLKTAIKDANRYVKGSVEPEIELLTKSLPGPQQGVSDYDQIFGTEIEDSHVPGLLETSDELQEYTQKRPKEWEIVQKALGLTRSFGVHAAAFILSDEPISNTVPLKNGNVAQYEMKEVESAGLIKYDFLVVNQLKDIEICLKLINKKNNENNKIGYFTHNGEKLYIWNLPEIEEVFKSIWDGKTETLFQINTKSMTPFVKDIRPKSIDDIGVILALVRPGPLDFIDEKTGRSMAEEYVFRRRGESKVDIPILGELVSETYGILCYQEGLTKIARELAGFPGDEAEKLRENMGKKKMSELQKMKPKFIEGASKKVDQTTAEEIWERMVTFGRYGFNKSHSIGYAHITYACMFLKYFYPLEWWASVLTNADEGEITKELWPYVKDIVSAPDINLSTDHMVVDYNNNTIRSKLGVIKGLGSSSIEPLLNGRPYKDIQDFVDKEVAGPSFSRKLIHVGVLDSLFSGKMSLIEKLKAYEDALEVKAFREKKQKAETLGKKIKASTPKQGQVPEEYINIPIFKDIAMRKAILPTMYIDLHSVAKKYSRISCKFKDQAMVYYKGYKETLLLNGYKFKQIDDMPAESTTKDVYFASTAYILDVKEFYYPRAKPTNKALKINMDVDGYITEKVFWPDYETKKLVYPKELVKGSIATIFFKKREGKKDLSIIDIVVET